MERASDWVSSSRDGDVLKLIVPIATQPGESPRRTGQCASNGWAGRCTLYVTIEQGSTFKPKERKPIHCV